MARTMYKLDEDDLGFHVVVWDVKRDRLERTLAASVSAGVAGAAYDQAVIDYGQDGQQQILLKHGARVMRDSTRSKVKT